jgi:hypothetical protein
MDVSSYSSPCVSKEIKSLKQKTGGNEEFIEEINAFAHNI